MKIRLGELRRLVREESGSIVDSTMDVYRNLSDDARNLVDEHLDETFGECDACGSMSPLHNYEYSEEDSVSHGDGSFCSWGCEPHPDKDAARQVLEPVSRMTDEQVEQFVQLADAEFPMPEGPSA